MPSYPADGGLPLGKPLLLLHLLLHVNIAQRFVPPRHTIKSYLIANSFTGLAERIPLPYSYTYSIGAVAPLISLLSGKQLPTILWWSIVEIMALLCQFIERLGSESEESIRTLEGLMYRAPGA
jgi:hypothetical protein